MGLAVFDGQVYPVWAGNFNQAHHTTARPSSPIRSTSGTGRWSSPPGRGSSTARWGRSRSPRRPVARCSISVTFDRPVTATTFVPGDVQVFFHNTTNGSTPISLYVIGVTPVPGTGSAAGGYTQFTVTFDPAKLANNTPSGITNYTGTYSYLIAPDNGAGLCHQLADRATAAPCWRRSPRSARTTRWTRTPTARPTRTR